MKLINGVYCTWFLLLKNFFWDFFKVSFVLSIRMIVYIELIDVRISEKGKV